ncbi:MAG: sulfatase [Planctomycetaceae bacterium]|nr:sulfatase [Planctomycetaceae bacterium]
MIRLLCCFLSLAIFSAHAPAAERNVIFFITDDESPTLGCYGDKAAVSPAIDAIAADGTLFTRAFATTASCSASRSVVMSGLHNHANGQYGHQHAYHKFASWHNVVSLALPRVMQRAGYRTAQIGKYHVAPEEVYRFETYLKGNSRNAVQMAEQSREFITSTDDERPFFLYFATSDPHRGGGTDQTSKRELKPDLFGNKPNDRAHDGVDEVFFDPADVTVPSFLPDTPETREELAQYYQSCARIDQGVARLVEILKEADLHDKTLIVFTSDHGMAFAGGKTTVYEGGLRVPFVVRNPYEEQRGIVSNAMISHIDITPSLLDFAGGLDHEANAPKDMLDADAYWQERGENLRENRGPRKGIDAYHGKSWIPILGDPDASHHETIFASHTFHEIQMYYPMRVVRDDNYKLIWNIAHGLPYPFASDLWAASSWQAQFQQGEDAPYGEKTVGEYIHRPAFELYDMRTDPHERTNLAEDSQHAEVLKTYKAKLKEFQTRYKDPWVMKWDYE